MSDVLLDLALEQEQGRNADQENSDRCRNERVDAGPIDRSKVTEQTNPENRSRNASRGQGHNHIASNRAFVEMDPARTDLGNKVEKSVRADRDNWRHSQKKNQNGQQEHTAAHSGHTNQSTYHEAD